ncbi:MAG: hypothetical protein MSC30_01095 [Gaiellaceae bacterium MAG52_C11]|nr:hypothetical protein [Candidatus Gaiellasilicea maunaloa]
MTLFDEARVLPGELVVVSERDNGPLLFEAAARSMGYGSHTAWAEPAVNPPLRPSWAFGGLLSSSSEAEK